jgi:hypothetical protein
MNRPGRRLRVGAHLHWPGGVAALAVAFVLAGVGIAGGTFGFGDPTSLAVGGGQIWVANSLANSLTVLPPG